MRKGVVIKMKCDSCFHKEACADYVAAADDAPVVHGYWDDSFDGITPVCSVCGMTHHEFVRCPESCPHCGAIKMSSCPKQDRCKNGLNCPREYIPLADYLCFENRENKQYKKYFHENYCPFGQRRVPKKKRKIKRRKKHER